MMTARVRAFLVVALAVIGCGSDTGRPVAPASVAPASHLHDVHFPEDSFAVAGIDLDQLRGTALWRVARRSMARRSIFATSCPSALDTARRVTVALRERGDLGQTFAIVQGIDRAQSLACLHRRPGAVPARAIRASDSRPQECQRYEDAVQALASCRVVPASLSGELKHAQETLGATPTSDAASGCARALAVVDRANARRTELAWPCEPDARVDAAEFEQAGDLDANTVVLDGSELVHFVEDHTAVIIDKDARSGPNVALLQRGLAAMLARRTVPPWYEASRTAIDARRAIWFSLDLDRLHGTDRREPLPRFSGSIDLRVDATADLRMAGVAPHDVFSIGPQIADDPMFKAATFTMGCAPPAPVGSRAAQCAEALAHRAALSATASTGPESSFDEIAREGLLARCVESSLPGSYFTCVNSATTPAMASQCDLKLSVEQQATYLDGPICGSRDATLQVELPLTLIESLKLAEIGDLVPRHDCRIPHAGTPIQVSMGPGSSDKAVPATAHACFGSGECWGVNLGADYTGPADGRWTQGGGLGDDQPLRCLGPFNLVAPYYAWSSPSGDACDFSLSSPDHRRPPVAVEISTGAKTLKICRGPSAQAACRSIQPAGAIAAISIDTSGSHAAIVTGAAGAQSIETWDLVNGKRVARFAARTTAGKPCARAQLLDDTVLVSTGACEPAGADGARPASQETQDLAEAARVAAMQAKGLDEDDRPAILLGRWIAIDDTAHLATLQGTPIARVGGSRPTPVLVSSPIALGGHRWAFVASTGDTAVVQDVATGVVEKRIATGDPVKPGKLAAAGDGLGDVVIALGGATARSGSVTVVDTTSGAATSFALPACPSGTTP